MRQFVFRACWSQTDQENFLVKAASRKEAEEKCKNSYCNPHHWDFVCEIYGEIK
jgi:hypothetical protein